MPRVVLDRSRCSGLGICESLAEDVFEIQDDGSLLVLVDGVCDADADRVRAACTSCPTGALRLDA